ncbi:MAG: hypothetical protein JW771_05670 [Candidatus Thermoplasmatota archaeon]|nr:hypothetical protein [Candidatus Thermoplasmatota archaeon]
MRLEMEMNDAHRSCSAVTETLALIIVIMIATSSISFIIFWGVPYMEQEKESVIAESALIQFRTINDLIQEVSGKGVNGSSMIDFVAEKGNMFISSTGERFIFYYSLFNGFDFNVSGLDNDDEIFFIRVEDAEPPMFWDDYYLYSDVSYLNDDSTSEDIIPINNEVIREIEYTYECPYALIEAVKIDIKAVDPGAPEDTIPVGRIWLFDPGSIYYELVATKGSYQMIAENGGVISVQNQQRYLAYEPNIRKNGEVLFVPLIQLTSTSENVLAGDSAARTFLIKSNGTFVRESGASVTTSFKCAIYGEHSSAWKNYFISQYKFIKEDGADILYHRAIKTFILTHSTCEIAIVG